MRTCCILLWNKQHTTRAKVWKNVTEKKKIELHAALLCFSATVLQAWSVLKRVSEGKARTPALPCVSLSVRPSFSSDAAHILHRPGCSFIFHINSESERTAYTKQNTTNLTSDLFFNVHKDSCHILQPWGKRAKCSRKLFSFVGIFHFPFFYYWSSSVACLGGFGFLIFSFGLVFSTNANGAHDCSLAYSLCLFPHLSPFGLILTTMVIFSCGRHRSSVLVWDFFIDRKKSSMWL